MSANRKPHRRRGRRNLLPVLVPVGVLAVAGAVAALVATGGGDDAPPAPGSPEELALGEDVFAENCQTCHGERARGGLAGPPLVHDMYQDLEDADIRAAVANGKAQENWRFAPMPPIPIDGDEVRAVIAYVRDQQRRAWGEEP